MNLKPYPIPFTDITGQEYKDSGIEWLGKIPEGWEVKKIKHTSYVKGRIGWHGLQSDEFIDEGPYLVTGTNLINGAVNWYTCYHISEERYNQDPYIHLKEKDLLITKDGTIGKVAFVKNIPDKASLNSGIMLIRPIKNYYLTDFMFWVLNSKVFNEYIEYTKTGSTVQHLYQETFDNFIFPLPLIEEQTAISTFLDHKTAKIDELIKKNEQLIELLKEKRQAVISHAVTKGIPPYPQTNPPIPPLLKGGKGGLKMKDSGIEWIGEIPEGWEVKRLKYVSLVNPEALNERTPLDFEIKYVDISNVNEEGLISEPELMIFGDAPSRARRIIRKGDVIISTVRTYLKAIAYFSNPESNLIVSTGFAVLRATKTMIPKFLYYFVRANFFVDSIMASSVGVSYPAINSSVLAGLTVLLPSKNEQKDIADYLDQETNKIDKTINKILSQIAALKEYRQALISNVVTGKVRVGE